MAFETVLEDIEKREQIDNTQILKDMYEQKNLNMKTHILSPMLYSIFETVVTNIEGLLLDVENLDSFREYWKIPEDKPIFPLLTNTLNILKQTHKEALVSWNREGRKEAVEVLKSAHAEGSTERSWFQKLLNVGRTK